MSVKVIPKVFGAFRLVEESELPEISKVLFEILPRSRRIYDSITISMRGLESSSPIYVPTDEHENYSGIVVALFAEYDDPTTSVSFVSAEKDAERACRMIAKSVDWKKEIIFGAVSEWHLPFLLKFSAKKGIIRYCVDCPFFQRTLDISPNDRSQNGALQNENSSEFVVKQLEKRFGILVDKAWKFRDTHSLAWIESQCEAGLGFGVFVPEEDEPVAWILAYRYGSMGLLHTRPNFRGRGYAKLCVQNLSSHLSKLGVPPNVYIENDNSISMSMFEKLGFEKMFSAAWMLVAPKDKFESEA